MSATNAAAVRYGPRPITDACSGADLRLRSRAASPAVDAKRLFQMGTPSFVAIPSRCIFSARSCSAWASGNATWHGNDHLLRAHSKPGDRPEPVLLVETRAPMQSALS